MKHGSAIVPGMHGSQDAHEALELLVSISTTQAAGLLTEPIPAARPAQAPSPTRPLPSGPRRSRARQRSRAFSDRLVTGRWPLLCLLAVQASLSLRLVWSNTAFQDEALYLWAGRLELAHWLHSAPVPDFATYFSGAPVVYPPLGALADALGGLAGARILSLCSMLGATTLLWSVTRRLFDQRAAVTATAVFAFLGPVQFLGAFATYDPMAVFLLAFASWLAIRSAGRYGEVALIGCAAVLVLADAAKYASLLWNPVVIALAILGPVGTRGEAVRRGIRLVSYAFALAIAVLFLAGGPTYVTGLMFTTLTRQQPRYVTSRRCPCGIFRLDWDRVHPCFARRRYQLLHR
jgi:4-amino-4-deoxy-L-arabinose transferase-like glycosyltransferase